MPKAQLTLAVAVLRCHFQHGLNICVNLSLYTVRRLKMPLTLLVPHESNLSHVLPNSFHETFKIVSLCASTNIIKYTGNLNIDLENF